MPIRPPTTIPPSTNIEIENKDMIRTDCTEPEAIISEPEEKSFESEVEKNLSEVENPIKNMGQSHREAYALGTVRNISNGKKQNIKAMIDNGNISKHGIVISEKLMQKLDLRYSKLQKGIIPTAGEHQGMTRLGVTEKFTLQLNGISNTYSIKALVCRELSDEINLGT